ncbi:MAG: cytochrome c class I, partial [Thiothrix lacustris]
CHGTNGTLENEAFMPLAGMPEQEFVKTMLDFRDGARQSTLMGTVANGLSEQQIRDMARYFMEVSP